MNKSMLKSLDVLEYILTYGDKSVTPSEITKATGISAPTCIRILDGLLARGYIVKRSRREGYFSGPAVISLSGINSFYGKMAQFAYPAIRRASEQIGHRTLLCTAAAGLKFLLCQHDVAGAEFLKGVQNDFYTTTSGRLLLSYFSENELSEYINNNGWPGNNWNGINTITSLKKELATIRNADHYSFVDLQQNICLTVPLILPDYPCFSISSYVLTENEVSLALAILKNAAKEIYERFYPSNVVSI